MTTRNFQKIVDDINSKKEYIGICELEYSIIREMPFFSVVKSKKQKLFNEIKEWINSGEKSIKELRGTKSDK